MSTSTVPWRIAEGEVMMTAVTGTVTKSGNVVRKVTIDSQVGGTLTYRTAPDSASTFDAANLRRGDKVVLHLDVMNRIFRIITE